MKEERHLYRSRDAMIGGVCAGIAEYFDIEPILIRILAVAFAVGSIGVMCVAYGALWAILPVKQDIEHVIDVEPEKVHSETYDPPQE